MTPTPGGAIPLSALDLTIAAGLILIAGAVSLGLRLGLERRLAVATARSVVQLLLIGYLLQWLFDLESAALVVLWLSVMVIAAGRAAVQRASHTFDGAVPRAWVTLALSATLTTFTVTGAIVGVRPWYEPQYVIPLMGMCLGNTLTGLSLCLDAFLEALTLRRDEVELRLCLGASRWEAARPMLTEAVRRGMVPIINAMTVVGIVSLPGMMTGQILAGADPMEAVGYQMVVMFMLAATVAIGCILMTLLAFRRLFNDRHQLLAHHIRPQR